jgi:hypothetical protein
MLQGMLLFGWMKVIRFKARERESKREPEKIHYP